jgi:hypothetical protein
MFGTTVDVDLLADCDLAAADRLVELQRRGLGIWSETDIAELADAASRRAKEERNDVAPWLFLRFGARPAMLRLSPAPAFIAPRGFASGRRE